jgi:hypothetical protein
LAGGGFGSRVGCSSVGLACISVRVASMRTSLPRSAWGRCMFRCFVAGGCSWRCVPGSTLAAVSQSCHRSPHGRQLFQDRREGHHQCVVSAHPIRRASLPHPLPASGACFPQPVHHCSPHHAPPVKHYHHPAASSLKCPPPSPPPHPPPPPHTHPPTLHLPHPTSYPLSRAHPPSPPANSPPSTAPPHPHPAGQLAGRLLETSALGSTRPVTGFSVGAVTQRPGVLTSTGRPATVVTSPEKPSTPASALYHMDDSPVRCGHPCLLRVRA